MQLRTYPISVSVFNLDYCPAVVWEFRGDAFLIWVLIKRAPWIQTVVYAALDMWRRSPGKEHSGNYSWFYGSRREFQIHCEFTAVIRVMWMLWLANNTDFSITVFTWNGVIGVHKFIYSLRVFFCFCFVLSVVLENLKWRRRRWNHLSTAVRKDILVIMVLCTDILVMPVCWRNNFEGQWICRQTTLWWCAGGIVFEKYLWLHKTCASVCCFKDVKHADNMFEAFYWNGQSPATLSGGWFFCFFLSFLLYTV